MSRSLHTEFFLHVPANPTLRSLMYYYWMTHKTSFHALQRQLTLMLFYPSRGMDAHLQARRRGGRAREDMSESASSF